MRQVRAVFRGLLLSSLRDKYTLFWDLVFPIILLVILVSIFGNLGETLSEVVFDVGLVTSAPSGRELVPIGAIVQEAFAEMAAAEPTWLNLYTESSLADELEALARGERHAVVHVQGTEAEVHIRSGRMMSEIAGDTLAQVLRSFNLGINERLGLLTAPTVRTVYRDVDAAAAVQGSFSFAAYMVPGIILMVFLSSGLGPMVQRLGIDRELGRLRRLFASPLSPGQYFGGVLLYILALSLVQVGLIYGAGALFFGVKLKLLSLEAVFFMVLSLTTLLSVGLVISALAKTANSASALSNALLYPMMFLGGLYFPVMQVPYPLRFLVLVNPVTYLVNGLRHTTGVLVSPTPHWANIVVPAVFAVVCTAIGLAKFNWDV
ncbi:MAG: ABC transporter permease [Limnochordia bacterium]|jgi:ABC-2 type transport system permease protein